MAAAASAGEGAPRGDGHFGRWIEDGGLPAYRYECDPDVDTAARYSTLRGPSTDHWHAFGNRTVTAAACGRGWVRLFDARHGPVWWQRSATDGSPFAGGAVQIVGDRTLSTIHTTTAPVERTFGAAWLRKRARVDGLEVEQICFCPDGDDAIVLSFSTLRWSGPGPLRIRLGESWALDPEPLRFLQPRAWRRWRARQSGWQAGVDVERGRVEARPARRDGLPERPSRRPPAIRSGALLALSHSFDAATWRPDAYFGAGPGHAPGGLATLALPKGAQVVRAPLCLALATDLLLGPGQPVVIAHGFAVGTEAEFDSLSVKYRGTVPAAFEETRAAWVRRAPQLHLPGQPWAGRELAWSGVQLAQTSVADEYFGTRRLTQGGNYLFVNGLDAAPRDLCQHALAALHVEPELALETLRTVCRMQRGDGALSWDLTGFGVCGRIPLWPSDLDLWLLWAAAEIGLATRRRALLDELHPFYPRHAGGPAPLREHLRVAFRHFVNSVGFGAHGLPRLRWGDWNDELLGLSPSPLSLLRTVRDGESTFNAALGAHALGRFAELLRFAGEDPAEVEAVRARLLGALEGAFTGRWFNRAWVGRGVEVGRDALYLEPQTYALLAGALDDSRARTLIGEIDARLRAPSPIGAAIHERPALGRTSDPGTLENGGVWFSISGPLVLGFARYDRERAFDEWCKSSLARHADVYPDTWFGIWTAPDSFNAFHSGDPGGTWVGRVPVTGWPVLAARDWPCMNAHAHGWPLLAGADLAGFSTTAAGYTFAPRLPERFVRAGFAWRGAPWSLEWTPERVQGHVTPAGTGAFRIRVEGTGWESARAEVDGRPVPTERAGDAFEIEAQARDGNPVRFALHRG